MLFALLLVMHSLVSAIGGDFFDTFKDMNVASATNACMNNKSMVVAASAFTFFTALNRLNNRSLRYETENYRDNPSNYTMNPRLFGAVKVFTSNTDKDEKASYHIVWSKVGAIGAGVSGALFVYGAWVNGLIPLTLPKK